MLRKSGFRSLRTKAASYAHFRESDASKGDLAAILRWCAKLTWKRNTSWMSLAPTSNTSVPLRPCGTHSTHKTAFTELLSPT